ncbi:MAG: hypothetical protein RSB76_01615 [Clostridia bacterium]
MKEWIRKIIVSLVLFSLIYIIVYNIFDVPNDIIIPNGATLIRDANKIYATTSITVIISAIILEVVAIFSFIEKTVSPQTNKINIIKLVIVSLLLFVISVYSYYVFKFTSVPIISNI